jgi:hypothetical protein
MASALIQRQWRRYLARVCFALTMEREVRVCAHGCTHVGHRMWSAHCADGPVRCRRLLLCWLLCSGSITFFVVIVYCLRSPHSLQLLVHVLCSALWPLGPLLH